MVYLNQAGTSWPKPPAVRQAAAQALVEEPERWPQSLALHHARVARFLGIRDPQRLLLTPGCTSALAVGLGGHPFECGDRIVISSLEHHALHGPVLALRERGVERVVVPPGDGQPLALERLERELRRGRVRMVAATAASNVTGELLPVAEIVALAHAHGASCLIDAAQVAGWLRLDLEALGVDLLTFAGHKGPHAPWGIGGLYVAPNVTMGAPPRAPKPAPAEIPEPGTMPGSCDVGSVDRAALAGLAAGFDWLEESAQRDGLDRARALIAHLEDGAKQLPGVRSIRATARAPRVPIVALAVEGWPPSRLAAALAERGIVASGGLQCAPLAHQTLGTTPCGVLRLSAGPLICQDDITRVLATLRELLEEHSG